MATNAPIAPVRDQRGERTAMLVIDMINPFDFEGGAAARRAAERVSETIIRLRSDADAHDVPTIYVNDNFGEWHSDRDRLIEAARPNLSGGAIEPRAADFFVIKPQFSGFYSTNLAVLLPKLGVRRLILTGIATEICVLITAADVLMYLGDLENAFVLIAALAAPDAILAFSVEDSGEPDSFVLRDSMRYAHGEAYVAALCAIHGFAVAATQKTAIRKDGGKAIMGILFVAARTT